MVRKCPICGKDFTPVRKDQWICSVSCATKYVDLSHKGVKVKQKCTICGKIFYKVEKSQFCSTECRLLALEKDYEERKKQKPKQKVDHLTETLAKCRELGMTYAEYQISQTKQMIQGKSDGKRNKGKA